MLNYLVKQKILSISMDYVENASCKNGLLIYVDFCCYLWETDMPALSFSVSPQHTEMKVCWGVQWFNQRFGVWCWKQRPLMDSIDVESPERGLWAAGITWKTTILVQYSHINPLVIGAMHAWQEVRIPSRPFYNIKEEKCLYVDWYVFFFCLQSMFLINSKYPYSR